MRTLAVVALAAALTACGSSDHGSRRFVSTSQTPEAIAGPRAGGPATLTVTSGRVVGKALLVVGIRGANIVVRSPRGGTLTVTHRRPSGSRAIARRGDHVSFTGTLAGRIVTASTVAVIG